VFGGGRLRLPLKESEKKRDRCGRPGKKMKKKKKCLGQKPRAKAMCQGRSAAEGLEGSTHQAVKGRNGLGMVVPEAGQNPHPHEKER